MSAAAEHAYKVIRSRILEGKYLAGQRLKEGELSAICDVSRTPVREALRKLTTDGLVRITPNSGAIVAEWNDADIADIYRVRVQIEVLAAEMAAERRTLPQLVQLENTAAAMKTEVERGLREEGHEEIARLNSEFHHCVIRAANSRALALAAGQVIEAPLMLRTFRRYDAERLTRSASDHIELVAAIRAQDAELASSIMRSHILTGLRAVQKGRLG